MSKADDESPYVAENGPMIKWAADGSMEQGLCDTCHGLDLRVSRFIVQQSRDIGVGYSPAGFLLRSSTSPTRLGTLQEIYERSSRGCRFCNLIIRSIHGSLRDANSDPSSWCTLGNATCYLSWEIDGRKVAKPEQDDTRSRRARQSAHGLTRRIHLRWDNQQLHDCHLVFVARERYLTTASDAQHLWGSELLFLGRKIDGYGNIQARAKSWVDLCTQQHGSPCRCPSRKAQAKFSELLSHSYFGVIDVVNMQLTELPTTDGFGHASYAALSYVWGPKRTFVTTLQNVNLLRMHGGLEKVLARLPAVIKDAIDLVRRLGLQYLWIDALCIVQNSSRSWRLNAYNMDSIYGNAELTICAADGEDASAGLKAMWPNNEAGNQEMADCAPGVRLMVSRPPELYIKASKWASRAWTFQERLLSRRCLIFINGRVYFQCRSTGMSEDIYADRAGAGWSLDFVDAPLQMFRQLSEKAFWVYMKVAELYSERDLTKPKDILAAFSGITNHMEERMKAPFVFGLPTSHFDLALLWQHTCAVERRKPGNPVEAKDYEDLEFPSWSWVGWMGGSTAYGQDILGDCLDNANEWLGRHTWIRWYIRDGNGDLRPLWTEADTASPRESQWHVDRSKDQRWRGYSVHRISGRSIFKHYSKRVPQYVIAQYNYDDGNASEGSGNSSGSGTSGDAQAEQEIRRMLRQLDRSRRYQERVGVRSESSERSDRGSSRDSSSSSSSASPPPRRRSVARRRRSIDSSHPLELWTALPQVFGSIATLRWMIFQAVVACSVVPMIFLSIVISTLQKLGLDELASVFERLRGRLLELLIEMEVKDRGRSRSDSTYGSIGYRSHARSRWRSRSPRPGRARSRSRRHTSRRDDVVEVIEKVDGSEEAEQILRPSRKTVTVGPSGGSHRRRRARSASPIQNIYDYSGDRHNEPYRFSRKDHHRFNYYGYTTRPSRPTEKPKYRDHAPAFDQLFRPPGDIEPIDTETKPEFFIYPKECPYRVVLAPYTSHLNSAESRLMPILQFWTWHTWLNVPHPTHANEESTRASPGPGLVRCSIADECGDWCGSIVLKQRWVDSASTTKQELIAISEAKRFTRDECTEWTYYIPKERDQSEWDLFYVLLVQRKDEKWERVGVGKVFKEAFMRSAKWKEIMLS